MESGVGAMRCASTPREAERRLAHRGQVLEELEAELATLSKLAHGEQHRKRVCELRASARYGRYLLTWEINARDFRGK